MCPNPATFVVYTAGQVPTFACESCAMNAMERTDVHVRIAPRTSLRTFPCHSYVRVPPPASYAPTS